MKTRFRRVSESILYLLIISRNFIFLSYAYTYVYLSQTFSRKPPKSTTCTFFLFHSPIIAVGIFHTKHSSILCSSRVQTDASALGLSISFVGALALVVHPWVLSRKIFSPERRHPCVQPAQASAIVVYSSSFYILLYPWPTQAGYSRSSGYAAIVALLRPRSRTLANVSNHYRWCSNQSEWSFGLRLQAGVCLKQSAWYINMYSVKKKSSQPWVVRWAWDHVKLSIQWKYRKCDI